MADWILLALVLLAVALSSVSFAALVEAFRQLAELRRSVDIDDKPLQLPIDHADLTGRVPSEVTSRPSAMLVFMHGGCATCRLVAGSFTEEPPGNVWFVIPREDVHSTKAFEGLLSFGRVILDGEAGGLAEWLRLDVAPAVVTVSDGVVTGALAISSVRQVTKLVQQHQQQAQLVAA